LTFTLSAHAQGIASDVLLTFDFNAKPLGSVLTAISEQANVSFSYNPKKIPIDQLITYQAQKKSLGEVLEFISRQSSVSYEIIEGQIVLKPVKRQASENITLSGFITDAGNGEALIGATVVVEELKVGTITNVYGFYSITIPRGNYNISYSFVGFEKVVKTVELSQPLSINERLQASLSVLPEIIVASENSQLANEVQLSKSNLKPTTVAEKPSLFGEEDAIRALEMMPGVKMHSDGSTFYYVRGGDRDQNLILIDDAPLFNPSHLLGIFSTIIPEAVNNISLYKGSMPASMGGRLSSVMDIRTKKGNDQHFQSSGNVGLLSSKLSLEGPITTDKSSYHISGRISRIRWISRIANDNIQKFQFYDLTGKVNFELNPKNRLFLSFYTGSDEFFTNNSGVEWSNRATTLRWTHLFTKKLFLNVSLAGGNYDYFLHTDLANQTKWSSRLSNVNLKGDFSYFKSPKEEITFGIALGGYNFNPGNISRRNVSFGPVVSVRNTGELVLYGNHEVRFGDRWGLSYGLRLSNWANEGESFEFVFDSNRNPVDTLFFKKGERYRSYGNAEPRVSLSYFFSESASLKASIARNVQNIHLINNSISPFTSFEVWLPSSINIQPQVANQVVIGYYKHLTKPGFALEVESYFKRMHNQIDYEAHAETLLNPLIERELRFGRATSYGAEIQLKKEEGRVRGLVGYSYSRAKRKFADINQGRTFNAFYDRPHQINLTLSADVTLRWNIGMNWIYSTGAPFSSPVSFYTHNGLEVPLYDQKNNDRLPDYHRLDLSATHQLNKNPEKKFKHYVTFSIYNFYGRKNTLFINYNKTEQADGSFKVPSNLLDPGNVSSEIYLFQFVPTIAYNFKWR